MERVKLRRCDVGYRKPPKHGQFSKGHSGNPKGRPRGSKNLAAMVIEEVTQLVTIVENGKRKRIPKFRAMVRQAIDKAVVGDFKAFQQILSMVRAHDALKQVVTRKRVVPAIHKGMSPSEAALAYQQTLTETFDEEN